MKVAVNSEIGKWGREEEVVAARTKEAVYRDRRGHVPKGMSENEQIAFGFLGGFGDDVRRGAKKRGIRNEEQLSRALKEIHGLCYKIRPMLAEVLTKLKNSTLRKKRGPQPRLTGAQRAAACGTIDTFIRNGTDDQARNRDRCKRLQSDAATDAKNLAAEGRLGRPSPEPGRAVSRVFL